MKLIDLKKILSRSKRLFALHLIGQLVLILLIGCQRSNSLQKVCPLVSSNAPLEKELPTSPRSFGNLVVWRFMRYDDGSVAWLNGRNLKDWSDHCKRFHIVKIEANKTTEVNATYTRIED